MSPPRASRRWTARLISAGRERWWRPLYVAFLAYAAASLVGNAAILGGFAWAQLVGPDVLARGSHLPEIGNFRRVDGTVYSGAQPDTAGFADLAAMGVTLVVDLRTGDLGDPRLDDPELLASLGMEYLHLPLTDGHAPGTSLVTAFVAAVEQAEGLVYMHCGGGVGRSGALQTAYLNATGGDFSLAQYLAVGPPTLEQAVYVARGEPGAPPANNALVAGVSRWVVDFPRTLLTWGRGLVD